MEIEIVKTEYKRVETKVKVNLPVEVCYYFITGERKSYLVKPIFYDEKLYEYNIIRVGLSWECVVEQFTLRVNELVEKSTENCQEHSIAKQLLNYPNDDLRTRSQFEADLKNAIDNFEKLKNEV